jgi:hypothetical protein
MERAVYMVAFLLVLAPVSAICISLIDNQAMDRYESMISEYDDRVGSLENEVNSMKAQQKETSAVRTQTPIPLEAVLPVLSDPQSVISVLNTLTKDLPKKDTSLLQLSASNQASDLLWASFLSVSSIVVNLLRFVMSHLDVVLDFTVRLVSYATSTLVEYLTSGRLLENVLFALPLILTSVFSLIPTVLSSLPALGGIAQELIRYLPQILAYTSLLIRNLPMFFLQL